MLGIIIARGNAQDVVDPCVSSLKRVRHDEDLRGNVSLVREDDCNERDIRTFQMNTRTVTSNISPAAFCSCCLHAPKQLLSLSNLLAHVSVGVSFVGKGHAMSSVLCSPQHSSAF